MSLSTPQLVFYLFLGSKKAPVRQHMGSQNCACPIGLNGTNLTRGHTATIRSLYYQQLPLTIMFSSLFVRSNTSKTLDRGAAFNDFVILFECGMHFPCPRDDYNPNSSRKHIMLHAYIFTELFCSSSLEIFRLPFVSHFYIFAYDVI